ncbi:MAG: methanethiol S-methyltransferase [Vicinamibacteria bacterium]
MTKRVLVFAYGVVSYVIFLATFLYAIGFIGGFAVPTRLDGPGRGPLGAALAIDVALLTVFALQHSVMARKWFKDAWTRLVPPAAERSTYVLFSSLALLLMFWQWRPIGGVVWSVEGTPGRTVLYGLFAFGWALVLACTFLINHFDLFGLRQIWLFLVGKPYTGLHFVVPGPYRLVRHPLYVGWLFAFWATPTMTAAHLLFAVATTAYILIAIQLEERDLVREHGSSYERYRRAVPMLWPGRRQRQPEPVEPAEPAVAVR